MGTHLSEGQVAEVVRLFVDELVPMVEIARRFGKTRQCIWKVLRREGVDVAGSGRLVVKCDWCGVEFKKYRSRVRGGMFHFCCDDHYMEYVGEVGFGGGGERVVRRHFGLAVGNVVHHIDKNRLNNHIGNLMVFRNRADHVRYHRLGDVEPVFDGRSVWSS